MTIYQTMKEMLKIAAAALRYYANEGGPNSYAHKALEEMERLKTGLEPGKE